MTPVPRVVSNINMPKSTQLKQKRNRKNKSKIQNLDQRSAQEKVFSEQRSYPGKVVPKAPKPKVDNSVSLSKCAFKYALAIADPFNPMARDACIPVYPSPPSIKASAVGRLTMAIGTQGVGFVLVSPCLANNLPALFYTNSSYALATISPLSANSTLQTGIVASNMSSPFTRAQLAITNGSSTVSGRMVSMGLRVRYTGTTMNESGAYYCYVTPDHSNVLANGISSPSDLGFFSETVVNNVTREPCELSIYSIDSAETQYSSQASEGTSQLYYPYSGHNTTFNGAFTYTDTSVLVGSPCAIIAVTGVAGSTFVMEIIQHHEFTGPSAYPLATPSDADQRGFEIVTAAAAQLPTKKSQSGLMHAPPVKLLFEGIKEVATALKPIALNALVKGAASLLL